MTTPRRERVDNTTIVNNLERILCNGRQVAAEKTAGQAVGNPPITPQSLQVVIEEVATPPLKAQGEYWLDTMADQLVSVERQPSRTQPTYFASLARLEITVRKRISIILALGEDALVWLSQDAGRATASNLGTNVIFIVQTGVNRGVAKAFWSAALY